MPTNIQATEQRFELRVRLRTMRSTLENLLDAVISDDEARTKLYMNVLAEDYQQALTAAKQLKLVDK